jgi:HNH endonuclease
MTVEEYLSHRAAGQKWCSRCRAWHPRERFVRSRGEPDGLTNRCKKPQGRFRGRRLKLATNGYRLIFLGVGHHLAHRDGYAYEHRVVAEQKLGRRLRPGEQVHHLDENKQNNDPANLEVVANFAAHQVLHRTTGIKKRLPGEPNPEVLCACGCGQSLKRFDTFNRPRRFIQGHRPGGQRAQ